MAFIDVTSDICWAVSHGFPDSGGNEVRVWDRRTGKCLHEMYGHDMSTNCCAILRIGAGAAAAAGGAAAGAVAAAGAGAGAGAGGDDSAGTVKEHGKEGGFDSIDADKEGCGSSGGGGGGGRGLEGMLVVSGSTDRTVKLWDAGGSQECLHTR